MMNKICPLCQKNKYRIIRGICQNCYNLARHHNNIDGYNTKLINTNSIILTPIQDEFITGSLLGDAWVTNLKYGRKSPSFGIDRKQEDLEYLEWQYGFVSNLCLRPIVLKDRFNKTTKKTHQHCSFETRYLPSLLNFRKLWYPNDIKIVPSKLKLTKLIMQIWYCDDGSLEIMDSGNFRIKFSTHGFTKDENMFLISLLDNRYNEKFSLVPDGDKYTIRANVKVAPVLIKDLTDNFPPGMKRKLP